MRNDIDTLVDKYQSNTHFWREMAALVQGVCTIDQMHKPFEERELIAKYELVCEAVSAYDNEKLLDKGVIETIRNDPHLAQLMVPITILKSKSTIPTRNPSVILEPADLALKLHNAIYNKTLQQQHITKDAAINPLIQTLKMVKTVDGYSMTVSLQIIASIDGVPAFKTIEDVSIYPNSPDVQAIMEEHFPVLKEKAAQAEAEKAAEAGSVVAEWKRPSRKTVRTPPPTSSKKQRSSVGPQAVRTPSPRRSSQQRSNGGPLQSFFSIFCSPNRSSMGVVDTRRTTLKKPVVDRTAATVTP